DVTGVIAKTKQAFEDGKYSDTVTYATLVDEMIKNLTNSYSVDRKTISEAQIEIQSKKDSGDDISASEKFLKNARSLFSQGEYDNACSIAEQAMKQQNFRPTSSLNIDLVIAIVLILGTIGTIFLILGVRMDLFGRIKFKKDLDGQETREMSDGTTLDNPTLRMFPEEGIKPSEPKPRNLSSTPINAMSSSSVEEHEIKEYMNQVVKEVNSVRMNALEEHTNKSPVVSSIPSVPPFSTMDKNRLAKIVSQMKSERPHLRPEEKELLDFLVEKNGLAFESELRSKFILPRTSLWRLVKRLEREEILEVTKIGGQNLIKLRV